MVLAPHSLHLLMIIPTSSISWCYSTFWLLLFDTWACHSDHNNDPSKEGFAAARVVEHCKSSRLERFFWQMPVWGLCTLNTFLLTRIAPRIPLILWPLNKMKQGQLLDLYRCLRSMHCTTCCVSRSTSGFQCRLIVANAHSLRFRPLASALISWISEASSSLTSFLCFLLSRNEHAFLVRFLRQLCRAMSALS